MSHDTFHVEVATDPTLADLRTLSEGIQDFNRRTVPGLPEVADDLKFAVFARDAAGKVVGGIRANAFWSYLNIELLWLGDSARGVGLGTRLVRCAEQFALRHGFKQARVETTSFQARPFYEKLGYRVYGELKDFPEGHVSYFLARRLQD
ncbi:MAG: GNAT family N-acetyltransferase [Proteobacteria bacterium]|nr:GNAT family N-acetyltransferase [Pseudomonadota bacterium]